jgi:hypothetical protein
MKTASKRLASSSLRFIVGCCHWRSESHLKLAA